MAPFVKMIVPPPSSEDFPHLIFERGDRKKNRVIVDRRLLLEKRGAGRKR